MTRLEARIALLAIAAALAVQGWRELQVERARCAVVHLFGGTCALDLLPLVGAWALAGVAALALAWSAACAAALCALWLRRG
jgi:hypothetical protein